MSGYNSKYIVLHGVLKTLFFVLGSRICNFHESYLPSEYKSFVVHVMVVCNEAK